VLRSAWRARGRRGRNLVDRCNGGRYL